MKPEKPSLEYPFGEGPGLGESLEVAPGVFWIRMPMPFSLNHINLWALDDGDGWTIVDTGLRTEATLAVWRRLFSEPRFAKPVKRVIGTHMHPDHIGMAGWLTRKFNCRIWMTQLEYLNCRVLMADTGRKAPDEALDFYRQAGWSPAALETYQARFGNFGKHIHPLPESFRRIEDDESIQIGEHLWRVVVGRGHSPEHACLFCEELRIFISGDQVLPKISSNVSVFPTEPDANPMQDWLQTLHMLQHDIPDDVLVLPSHNDCFRGLHARLDYLAKSQSQKMLQLLAALEQPKRVVDVFAELFARNIDPSDSSLLSLATGESVACLNYLLHCEEITRTLDASGVAIYQRIRS
jgi:glyoxylase-like metal-dependent hydrolase (beta-lactamase superfamily II)